MHDVQRLNEAWNRAYQERDHAALEGILAPDWTVAFTDGRTVDRAALLEQLPKNPMARLEFSDFAMRVFGDAAVTWGCVEITGERFTVTQRFMRVWARRNGVWQAVAVQVVPVASNGTQPG